MYGGAGEEEPEQLAFQFSYVQPHSTIKDVYDTHKKTATI
jgi:hypothetical protein